MRLFLTFSALLLFFHGFVLAANCFLPNGASMTNTAFEPCNRISGAFSSCCATNWTSSLAFLIPDVCETNGLCLDTNSDPPRHLRGGCSDWTWRSANCLANLCTGPEDNGDPAEQVEVTQCTDGKWCCGDHGTAESCCNNNQGVELAATVGLFTSRSSTSPTSPASSASTTLAASSISLVLSTSTVSEVVSSPQSPISAMQTPLSTSHNVPPGEMAGIVCAVVFGVASSVFLGFYVCRRANRLKEQNEHNPANLEIGEMDVGNASTLPPGYRSELDAYPKLVPPSSIADTEYVELVAAKNQEPYELP